MFTPVSSQPDYAQNEEEVLKFWQEHDIFQKSLSKNQGKQPYVIYDGPPTANSKPPLHTMVPMSFKDLVGRYKTMRGHYVPRQAGWDTHGLPVEVQVEKALGLASKKDVLSIVPGDEAASIRAFNKTCRESVWEYKQVWDTYIPRVGYWIDTEHPYITYENSYIEKVWGILKQIWDKDLVYKSYKVVPYCPRCGTALSIAEVSQEYHDVKDVTVFVSFPLADSPDRSFLAWTTTPWTLPSNVALVVGPDIDYVAIEQKAENGERKEYILAKSRLEIVKGEFIILEEMKGSALVGLRYGSLYPEVLSQVEGEKNVVVAADFVTTEDGTGIVHTAVMYGEDDFVVGKAHGLAMRHTVGLDGCFLPDVPEFAGMNVRDALVPILQSLQGMGRLYAKKTITHSYPFCWRCKTALIYYAKDSWFIRMSSKREELVASNGKVAWIPEHIKEGRFGDFIREARDWAISRERFWGTPLPIWSSEDGEYICIGSLEELQALSEDPQKVPADLDLHRPFIDEIRLVKDGKVFSHEPLVMDVWFDSGSMPYASGREEKGEFPADYIAEAIDQTRGWFNSLMAIGTVIRGESPYRNVVCMGHLVDGDGKKMSKSGTNAVEPFSAFKELSVDALRWFFYSVNSPGESKSFSKKEIQTGARKSIVLTWNVFNYFVTYANYNSWQVRPHDRSKLSALDEWLLSRQANVVKAVTRYLDEYDFMRASRTLEAYIDELSTWYLRRSRKRNDDAFFGTLHEALMTLVTMLAPFVPFVSETIYQVLRTREMPESVHLRDWPRLDEEGSSDIEMSMKVARKAVELGLSLRAMHKLKVRQPLSTAYMCVRDHTFSEHAQEFLAIIAEELNVRNVVLVDTFDEGVITKEEEGITISLDTVLTDELLAAGSARDLLRHIQQIRKQEDLQPGEMALLIAGPASRDFVTQLIISYPEILEDAFCRVDDAVTWQENSREELTIDGHVITLGLLKS
jgi:isoleucyl-tRNA synthetase